VPENRIRSRDVKKEFNNGWKRFKNGDIGIVANLVVLPPGMVAFGAAEEPDLALIGSTQLAQPPDREVVLALRALDLDRGHGFYFIILIIHNRDLILRAHLLRLHLVSCFYLADISAFPALELTPGRDHHRLTFRAEHRYSMRDARRLTLLSGLGPDLRILQQYFQNRQKARVFFIFLCYFVLPGEDIHVHGRILFLVLRG
jgi:hypothetical protein